MVLDASISRDIPISNDCSQFKATTQKQHVHAKHLPKELIKSYKVRWEGSRLREVAVNSVGSKEKALS